MKKTNLTLYFILQSFSQNTMFNFDNFVRDISHVNLVKEVHINMEHKHM